MEEDRLPPEVLAKASHAGNEYAWRPEDVPGVLAAAQGVGLATIGGQFQFRLPEGTCEMFWLNADSTARRDDEPWSDYAARSAQEVLSMFLALHAKADFGAEARSFEFLKEPRFRGVDLTKYLCFVLYFQGEQERHGAKVTARHFPGLPLRPGAKVEEIESVERSLGRRLPDDYRRFLEESDGVEGFFGPGAFVSFWRIGDLLSLNSGYSTGEFAPGLVLIGTDGGGTGYGVLERAGETVFVRVPLVGLSSDSCEHVGQTFAALLSQIKSTARARFPGPDQAALITPRAPGGGEGMAYEITPRSGAGPLLLDMTREQVQAVLGAPDKELLRSEFTDYVEWLYHVRGVFVGFDRRGRCGEITLLSKSAPRLGGVSLLQVGAADGWAALQRLDARATEDDNHSLISRTLCVSIFAPHIEEEPAEPATNVMVFRPDYLPPLGGPSA